MAIDDTKTNDLLRNIHDQEAEQLAVFMAENKFHLPYIDLSKIATEADALKIIEEVDAKNANICAFKITGKELFLATENPDNEKVQAILQNLKDKNFIPKIYVASKPSLEKAWSHYGEISHSTVSDVGSIEIDRTILDLFTKEKTTIGFVQDEIKKVVEDKNQHQSTRLLATIFASAVALKASDVHIEALENHAELRFRIDGVLQLMQSFDLSIFRTIDSRIKILSGLKLTISKNAQDGRFSIFVGEIEISIRTSMIPGEYGESIVMRLLDPRSILVKLEDLGINSVLLEIIEREIKKPNGLILLTGPTGSGKTTTLYAFLQHIFSKELKAITIENPIEYHLSGVTQTQVNEEKHYGFAEGLKSALRQDPDIIMVGEIRDNDTATVAVEASLTGHIVFSTLHTKNAEGVIPRLLGIGVNEKTLASALSLSLAQRLVRKICKNCKEEIVATEDQKNILKKIILSANEKGKKMELYGISEDMEIKLWHGKGCDVCGNTGYKGQTAIFEGIVTDKEISEIIEKNPNEWAVKQASEKQGILDMRQDVVVKILKGITTVDEASSVIDLEEAK